MTAKEAGIPSTPVAVVVSRTVARGAFGGDTAGKTAAEAGRGGGREGVEWVLAASSPLSFPDPLQSTVHAAAHGSQAHPGEEGVAPAAACNKMPSSHPRVHAQSPSHTPSSLTHLADAVSSLLGQLWSAEGDCQSDDVSCLCTIVFVIACVLTLVSVQPTFQHNGRPFS